MRESGYFIDYKTLGQSSQDWHEGKHDPWPYINYVLYILKSAYRVGSLSGLSLIAKIPDQR